MIFSRLIEHIKHERWTGALIELAIVILGVFIGLQANNWNQARADTRLGRQYVTRLTRDLDENLAGVRAEVAYYTDVLKSVQQTDALLRAAAPDPRALVVNAYRASEIAYTPPVRATWDQIVSSGHLDLLPGKAAESGLSQYYAFDNALDTYHMGLDSDYRKAVRKIIPMSMQIAIRTTCSDVRNKLGYVVGFVKHCKFKADSAALDDVAATLRRNRAVAADLRYQYSFVVGSLLNLRGVKDGLENTLSALGARPKATEAAAP